MKENVKSALREAVDDDVDDERLEELLGNDLLQERIEYARETEGVTIGIDEEIVENQLERALGDLVRGRDEQAVEQLRETLLGLHLAEVLRDRHDEL